MAKEKTVKMPAAETHAPDVQTLMEQLSSLSGQNKMLKERLNQAVEQIKYLQEAEVHKRLEWLWRVLSFENGYEMFGSEFYNKCLEEFQTILNPGIHEEEPAAEK